MIITIEVVRLSRMAERMNVIKAIRHSKAFLLFVCKVSRTKLKPPFWSTSSTIVMAPIRKNSVVDVLPRCFSITSLTARAVWSPMAVEMYWPGSIIKRVQQPTNISKAMAALFTFVTLSRAIQA